MHPALVMRSGNQARRQDPSKCAAPGGLQRQPPWLGDMRNARKWDYCWRRACHTECMSDPPHARLENRMTWISVAPTHRKQRRVAGHALLGLWLSWRRAGRPGRKPAQSMQAQRQLLCLSRQAQRRAPRARSSGQGACAQRGSAIGPADLRAGRELRKRTHVWHCCSWLPDLPRDRQYQTLQGGMIRSVQQRKSGHR